MLKSNYFSICTVDNVCQIIGAQPQGAAYDMLRTLHCIHYSEMPREVMEGIPALMREVFSKAKLDDEAINGVLKGIRA